MLRLELRLQTVVLRRGHDGFLRGQPEPVLLPALYQLRRGEPCLVGKTRFALAVTQPFPSTVTPDAALLQAKLDDRAGSLALLCAAFEEDSGEDLALVASQLEDPSAWSVRAADSPIAAPFALADLGLAHWATPSSGQQVELLHRGVSLATRCTSDDWIGAVALVFEPRRGLQRCAPRIAAANGRNDWELKLELRLR
jgi:hypothetical protein